MTDRNDGRIARAPLAPKVQPRFCGHTAEGIDQLAQRIAIALADPRAIEFFCSRVDRLLAKADRELVNVP